MANLLPLATLSEVQEQKLRSLMTDYTSITQGRNRRKALNHLEKVRRRRKLINIIEQRPHIQDLLIDGINTDFTHDTFERLTHAFLNSNEAFAIRNIAEEFKAFIQRDLIEFHPTDYCQLKCSGCTFGHDCSDKQIKTMFPENGVNKILSILRPKAITIVGGGEPSLYKSNNMRLGDLIVELVPNIEQPPKIGLISNGIRWPKGNQDWHSHVDWMRISLDAGSPETHKNLKGVDRWEQVLSNIERLLNETSIPEVGVGFLYRPENIHDAVPLIKKIFQIAHNSNPSTIDRINIQFRPWRPPNGRPLITDRIIGAEETLDAITSLLEATQNDSRFEDFVKHNTNLPVNLLCQGARENVSQFQHCTYGMAKAVVRADGAIYPCFRTAASEDSNFYMGNIVNSTYEELVFRYFYVLGVSAPNICISDHESCLLCVFNNLLESGLGGQIDMDANLQGNFFF